jgi:signal transduction histidine kinase
MFIVPSSGPSRLGGTEALMRWSIHTQILIPLISIQAITVTAVALTTATVAARRSEREIIARLNDVLDTLRHGNIPYTASVLAKMRGLSGAHFIAAAEDGHVTETSLPPPENLPDSLRSVPTTTHIESLQECPTVVLAATRYFAVSIRSSSGPRDESLFVLYPETLLRQARWEAVLPPLMLGVGSLGAMVLVTSWIAHRISGRIGRIRHQVARIAAGDFHELEIGRQRDEVEDLSLSINQMCLQLRGMRRTIHQSERARLLAQLAAGLAHQLRNSLTGARMSVQLYLKRHPGAAADETLTVALRQLALTEEQVKGLLSVGRVERRPLELCDPWQIFDDVATLVDPTCQHAKVALCWGRGDRNRGNGSLALLADRSSLRAAILNLTINAIEAAGPGGRVRMEAHLRDDDVAVEVVDSGPGPGPELAENLFEPFVTSKAEGVGLGLALAHQVALDHGGRLSWTRDGDETRFCLTLPRSNGQPRGTDESNPDR